MNPTLGSANTIFQHHVNRCDQPVYRRRHLSNLLESVLWRGGSEVTKIVTVRFFQVQSRQGLLDLFESVAWAQFPRPWSYNLSSLSPQLSLIEHLPVTLNATAVSERALTVNNFFVVGVLERANAWSTTLHLTASHICV